MRETAAAALLVTGAAFMLLSAVGILRMPDLFTRMHAATKLPTLGIACVFLAVAVHFWTVAVAVRALLGIAFFYLTVPVGTHMIGRAAYLARTPLWRDTLVDELRGRYDFETGRLEAPGAARGRATPPQRARRRDAAGDE